MAKKIKRNIMTVTTLREVITLNDSQIKSWPSNNIEIVAAQGSGKAIIPIRVVLIPDYPSAAYGNISAGNRIGIVVGSNPINSNSFLVIDSDAFGLFTDAQISPGDPLIYVIYGGYNGVEQQKMQLATGFKSEFDNAPLKLKCTNTDGNFTGGDSTNSFKIITDYTVIDL